MRRLAHLFVGMLVLTVLWHGAAYGTHTATDRQQARLPGPAAQGLTLAAGQVEMGGPAAPLVLWSTRYFELLLRARNDGQAMASEDSPQPHPAYGDPGPDLRSASGGGSAIAPLLVGRAATPDDRCRAPVVATRLAPRGQLLGMSTKAGFVGF